MGVGKSQSEDSFLCFGAKPTQKGLRAIFPTKLEDEGRKVRDSTKVDRRDQDREQDSWQERAGDYSDVWFQMLGWPT